MKSTPPQSSRSFDELWGAPDEGEEDLPPALAPSLQGKHVSQSDLNETVNILNLRVNGLGVSGAQVQTTGKNQISVSIPGVTDLKELTPKMMAALPEAARIAVSNAYSAAFTPLFMTSCTIALMGLAAAIMLKPAPLPKNR